MSTTLKNLSLPILIFVFLFFLALIVDDLTIWGSDGTLLWLPILSEYIKNNYYFSDVVFGGQNLLSLYGEIPFWKILRFFNATPVQILNLTYVFLFIMFYIPVLNIYQGLKESFCKSDYLIVFFFILLSPLIANRLYSGHFNLLFGLLPLIISISLIYKSNIILLIFYTLSISCTFSTQSYQILSYHFFYIPILLVWLNEEKKIKDPVFWFKLLSITALAFLFSFQVFKELLNHSQSDQNLRAHAGNIVYSYITSDWSDIPFLFFSSYNNLLFKNHFFLFHEMNYPLGLSFLIFFLTKKKHRSIFIILLITIFFLFLVSSNIIGFNIFSELPVIRLFRVPQRSLILPVFLFTLLALGKLSKYFNFISIAMLLILVLIGNWIDYFEVVLSLLVLFLFLFYRKNKNYMYYFSILITSSFLLGLPPKIEKIIKTNSTFFSQVNFLNELNKKLNFTKNNIVHFESFNSIETTAAANYVGIRTVEGYGHPPRGYLLLFNKITGIVFDPMTNIFNFKIKNHPEKYKDLIKDFKITDTVLISLDGKVIHQRHKTLTP